MKLLALLLCLFCAVSSAQETTSNLVEMRNWSGIEYPDPSVFSLCCTGGPAPAMNTDTNTMRFSYELSTVSQTWGISSVLSGQGIKVTGFNYSWLVDNSGSTAGYVGANVSFTSKSGNVVENYNYEYSTTNGFVLYSGTETFAKEYNTSNLGSVSLSFTGKDANWWAGYYGPRVRDVSLTLNYSATALAAPDPVPVTSTVTTLTDSSTIDIVTTTMPGSESTTVITTATPVTGSVASPLNVAAFPVTATTKATASAVSQVLRNNAAQQSAIQTATLATADTVTTQPAQDTANNTTSDSVSLGLAQFGIAARQGADAQAQDAASPTSTRNLAAMMVTPATTEDQEQQARARTTASSSSSAANTGVDLGTGVSMSAMAVTPPGYQAYQTQIIEQVAFYATKEIYRNQRVVDNAPVQRGLSGRNDRVHNIMVEQQYKGN